jgi:hypothetical protein
MWFRVCRGCGGLFDEFPALDRLRDRGRANGALVRPRVFCSNCVMTIILNWKDDDDDQ